MLILPRLAKLFCEVTNFLTFGALLVEGRTFCLSNIGRGLVPMASVPTVVVARHIILGHLGVKFTSGGTTIPLNLIETEQELKGS